MSVHECPLLRNNEVWCLSVCVYVGRDDWEYFLFMKFHLGIWIQSIIAPGQKIFIQILRKFAFQFLLKLLTIMGGYLWGMSRFKWVLKYYMESNALTVNLLLNKEYEKINFSRWILRKKFPKESIRGLMTFSCNKYAEILFWNIFKDLKQFNLISLHSALKLYGHQH